MSRTNLPSNDESRDGFTWTHPTPSTRSTGSAKDCFWHQRQAGCSCHAIIETGAGGTKATDRDARIAEIVTEFNEDRDDIGEVMALTNLARAFATVEESNTARRSTGSECAHITLRKQGVGEDSGVIIETWGCVACNVVILDSPRQIATRSTGSEDRDWTAEFEAMDEEINQHLARSTGSCPDRCQTWGYYTGRQCSEPKDHEGRHITEPAVGRFSAGRGAAPPSAPDPDSRLTGAIRSLATMYHETAHNPESSWKACREVACVKAFALVRAAPDPEGLPSVAIEWARELLRQGYRDEHIATFTDDGYGLEHPIRCRPDLTGCILNEWLRTQTAPDREPGRYVMEWADDGPTYARLSPVEPTDKKRILDALARDAEDLHIYTDPCECGRADCPNPSRVVGEPTDKGDR